jgi:predicted dehydrogenase/sugar phosphate isomerase/epimerase
LSASLSFGSTAWTFSWLPPYERAIQRIARAGCKHVELVAWNVAGLQDYYTRECIATLKTLISGEGLTLTNFFFNLPFAYSERAPTSAPNLDGFRRAVDAAAALGSKLITSGTPYPFGRPIRPILQRPTSQEWTAPIEPQWDWTGEYENVVGAFASACEAAADAGLRVAIEPHPYRWVCSAQGMLRLIEHVRAPNLGLNFDPSHLFPSGDMPHFTILLLKDRIFNTHFSDNEGHTNAHWRPGRGKIDWTAIFAALNAITGRSRLSWRMRPALRTTHIRTKLRPLSTASSSSPSPTCASATLKLKRSSLPRSPEMRKPGTVQVGIVGCGNIAATYVATLRMFDFIHVKSVSDAMPAAATKLAAEFDLAAPPVDALVADPDIEVVINLTMPVAHAEISAKALRAGKHVYSEKPLGVSMAEAETLVELAKRNGLRLGCAPDTFMGGGHQVVRRLIDEGAIGAPIAGTALMLKPGHEHWHPNPHFFYAYGGGPILDVGPYYVTNLIALLGPARRVVGFAKRTRSERVVLSEPRRGEIIKVEVPTHTTGVFEFENAQRSRSPRASTSPSISTITSSFMALRARW